MREWLLRFSALLIVCCCLVALSACGGAAAPAVNPGPPVVPPGPAGPTTPPPTPSPPPSSIDGIPQFAHVVLVVEENHGYDQVIGNSAMPFLNQLASNNALATQYFADAHPSIPNYFMMATGRIETLNDDFTGTISDDNLVRELLAAGKTWMSYAESLPSTGYVGGNVYPYLRRHNPLSYMSDVVGTAQAANLAPFSQFSADLAAGRLPNFSFVVPNAEHDAHDCPDGSSNCADSVRLGTADTWLQQNIGPLLSDAGFQQSGLLIVVFDEGPDIDVQGGGGHVPMVMAGTGVKLGLRSSSRHDHAGLLRLVLQALGVQQYPGASAGAASLSEFF